MTRKTLLITIIILTLSLGAFVLYFFLGPVDEEGNRQSITDFFPFGRSGETGSFDGGDGTDTANGDTAQDDTQKLLLRQLSSVPVAGATVFTEDDNTNVRYVERGTGHVYEVALEEFQKTRLTNTTVPAIREAIWKGDGTEFVLRYLNTNDVIKSFAGRIAESDGTGDTPNQLEGSFIEDEIQFIIPSPDKERMFYIFTYETNTIGITSNFDNTNREEVFNSPFTEWLPEWPSSQIITLTTKAASVADGFLYFLDLRSGQLKKVLGGILGLTTNTAPGAGFILFSESGSNTFETKLYNQEGNTTYNLPITTLPEKCAWSSAEEATIYCGVPKGIERGAYPDIWYQGVISFSDTIWKVNVSTRLTEKVVDPLSIARVEMDIINPMVSGDGEFLVFTNKKDSTLWSLELEQD